MYSNRYLILEDEEKIIASKNDEFKLFYKYVRNIYLRCRHQGLSRGRILWEDFPYDLYTDVENWINFNTVKEIKEYIDEIKIKHEIVRESAKQFWQHWLKYKNVNKIKI